MENDLARISSTTHPVPLDMIEAWLRGEYLTGQNESIGYEYLGWALMLRGTYLYEVQYKEKEKGEDKTQHWGICMIDLKDGDLTYQGVRLGACDSLLQSNMLWYSIFSKLTRIPTQSSTGKPDVYFGYGLHSISDQSQVRYKLTTLVNARKTDLDLISKKILTSGVPSLQQNTTSKEQWDTLRGPFHKYLVGGNFERDKQTLIEATAQKNPETLDDVAAITHVNLEDWNWKNNKKNHNQPKGKGHLYPCTRNDGQVYHIQQGIILFSPLLPPSKC